MGYFSNLDLENKEFGMAEAADMEPENDYDNSDVIWETIEEEAKEIALKEYKKPLMELSEHERNEVVLIAENRVLGL
tara:strand:+ start:829 stop:1059 length:231 start_codon:yes stop_codon:yes gene_type:complete